MTPSRAALIRDLVRSATTERKSRSGRVAMKDGRHFEFAAVPLPDGNALFTMLDVTDSRRIERVLRERAEALEAADKVKTSFVANMSYELRTPLTSIGGFAEMLSKGYAGELGEHATAYVDAITESVAKLAALVDDVLQLTQNQAGLAAVDRETIDLLQIVDLTIAAHEDAAQAKHIDFASDLHVSVGRVEGDSRRLRSALNTLVESALSHTQERGRILLHANGDADHALIVVSDNGPGMDAPALRAAFGTAAEPTPLGIARQAIEADGGTLTLISEPGQGTAAKIVLIR
jgi:signal transduction histidine kinase